MNRPSVFSVISVQCVYTRSRPPPHHLGRISTLVGFAAEAAERSKRSERGDREGSQSQSRGRGALRVLAHWNVSKREGTFWLEPSAHRIKQLKALLIRVLMFKVTS